jgi:type IV pilus assembly protein PilW
MEVVDSSPKRYREYIMIRKESGFTLVELLVALALTGIVMTVVYKTFASQQKVYVMQENGSVMQQDLRAAMEIMSKDIRMAGYSPARPNHDPNDPETARIVTATASTLTFTLDSDDDGSITDGDAGDSITYDLAGTTLRRQGQPVADNISKLNFVYLDDSGDSIPYATLTAAKLTEEPTLVKSIQITLVARSEREDQNFTNKTQYYNQVRKNEDWEDDKPFFTAPGDRFRRRLLTTMVRCRNLGD